MKDLLIIAACSMLVLGVALLASVANASDKVSVQTFETSQAAQDRKFSRGQTRQNLQIWVNREAVKRQEARINIGEELITDLESSDQEQRRALSVLSDEFELADEKSRERDAAIAAMDKPFIMPGQASAVEMGLARAGGKVGIGLSAATRFNEDIYGTFGFGASGGSAAARLGVGIGW